MDTGGLVIAGLGVVAAILALVATDLSKRVRVAIVLACFAVLGLGVFLAIRDSRDGGNKARAADIGTTVSTTTSPAPTVVPSARGGAEVRACMVQHGMSRAVTTSTTLMDARGTLPGETPETAQPDPVTVFQRCDWPRKPWSDNDGYSQISVQSTIGPGESEASDANVADIIKSDCKLLEVKYSVAAQGYQERLPAFRSKPYRAVYYYRGEEYRAPPEEPLNFYYEDDELVVLRNSKVRLDRVSCVK